MLSATLPYTKPGPKAPRPPRVKAGGKARAQRWGAARNHSAFAVLRGPPACLQWAHPGQVYSGDKSKKVKWRYPGPRRTSKYTRSAQSCGGLAAAGPHRFPESRPVMLAKVGCGPGRQAGAWKAGVRAGCSGLSCPLHLFNPGRACGSGWVVPRAARAWSETHALHRVVFHADACTPVPRGVPKTGGRGGRLDATTRALESENLSLNARDQPKSYDSGTAKLLGRQ